MENAIRGSSNQLGRTEFVESRSMGHMSPDLLMEKVPFLSVSVNIKRYRADLKCVLNLKLNYVRMIEKFSSESLSVLAVGESTTARMSGTDGIRMLNTK